jgi:hypothetical protein
MTLTIMTVLLQLKEMKGLDLLGFQVNEIWFMRVKHRFLIEVDCSLVIKHNSKLNGFQTIQMRQVFFALLSSSEPSFELNELK